jgi:F420-non-reducing hydrogenase iron-sulfur subunit
MGAGTAQAPPKIVILASVSGGYAGADAVGQLHTDYPAGTYILPVRSPAMFLAIFYMRAFEQGIDAILIMYSGSDSPFKGDTARTAEIVNQAYRLMKARGIDTRRLRLVAFCTVCTKPFLKEVNQMVELLQAIGPVCQELAAAPVAGAEAQPA